MATPTRSRPAVGDGRERRYRAAGVVWPGRAPSPGPEVCVVPALLKDDRPMALDRGADRRDRRGQTGPALAVYCLRGAAARSEGRVRCRLGSRRDGRRGHAAAGGAAVSYRLIQGDALAVLRDMPAGSVQTACTSPPYWGLRDYGVPGQLGNEHTPQEYVAKMVAVFREVRRVLRDDGTCWINIGDSYTSGGRKGHGTRVGYKQQANRGMNGTTDPIRAPQPHGLRPKSLCLIPERLALALQEDGWIVRSRIAWTKGSVMPEGVRDRCTPAWEHIWMLAKQAQYYCDMEAVRQKAIHESRVVRYDGTQKNTGHENRTYPGASGPREIVVF